MTDKLTVADFFCGAGGFSEGFREKGFDVVFALDNWEPAIETHKKMHPEAEHRLMDVNDIRTAEEIDEVVPDVDVIVGGPPCQNFSMSNKAGKADKTEGLNLIECMLRIIAWKKEHGGLKYWALENVPKTQSHMPQNFSWEQLGLPGDGEDLQVGHRPIHCAADYGAPQERNRMVAGEYPELRKRRSEDDWRTVKEVFSCLGNPLKPEEAPNKIEDPNREFSVPREEITDHFYDTRVEEYRWKRAKRLKTDHGYMGKMSFPEDTDRPSRTVMATRSASTREAMIFEASDGQRESYRLPTVREIATFMAYPLDYQFEASTESKKYRLVGNSIPVKLSSAVAEAIARNEGMEVPDGYEKLPDVEPETDLTGNERDFREPRSRRMDSTFSRHVPYLKTKAFRPSLTNRDSKPEEGIFEWSAVIHKGVGKNASEAEPTTEEVIQLLRRGVSGQMKLDEIGDEDVDLDTRLREFISIFEEEVKPMLPDDSEDFHMIYTRRKDSDLFGPHEALEELRDVVDEIFPEGEFEESYLDNSDRVVDVPDDDVPVRVAAGYLGCRMIAELVSGRSAVETPVAT